MNIDKIKDLLLSADSRNKFTSGQKEIAVRCPHCGDSQRTSHPHLYIQTVEGEPLLYDCKRCPAQGIVTPMELMRLGVYDTEAIDYVRKLSITSSNNRTININERISRDKVVFPKRILKSDQFKVDYLKARTGIDFNDIDNIKKFRIVLNLEQFVRENNITVEADSRFRDLSRMHVGFLNFHNDSIKLRNASTEKTNFDKYSFDLKSNRNTGYIYIPELALDPLAEYPRIIAGEGPFDIIGAISRYYNMDQTNTLFLATGSLGSYKTAIRLAHDITCYYNAELLIYSDQEVPLKQYDKMFNDYKKMGANAYVYYNNLSKDFGDIRDPVRVDRFKLY